MERMEKERTRNCCPEKTTHKKCLSKFGTRPGKYDYLDKKDWDEHVTNYPEIENTASDLRKTEFC